MKRINAFVFRIRGTYSSELTPPFKLLQALDAKLDSEHCDLVGQFNEDHG